MHEWKLLWDQKLCYALHNFINCRFLITLGFWNIQNMFSDKNTTESEIKKPSSMQQLDTSRYKKKYTCLFRVSIKVGTLKHEGKTWIERVSTANLLQFHTIHVIVVVTCVLTRESPSYQHFPFCDIIEFWLYCLFCSFDLCPQNFLLVILTGSIYIHAWMRFWYKTKIIGLILVCSDHLELSTQRLMKYWECPAFTLLYHTPYDWLML